MRFWRIASGCQFGNTEDMTRRTVPKQLIPRNFLAAWRQHRGMSQETLATAVRSTKATISRLESGKRGLSQKWLERLGPALDATPAQLLDTPERSARATPPQTVPLIDSVRAGNWHEVVDPYALGDGIARIPVRRRVGPRAFALELDGPSMEPDFHHGDVIIVDPDIQPKPGNFVVARIDLDNVATFKRYRVTGLDGRGRPIVELVPLNTDWPVMPLGTAKGGGRIVGVAVEHHRKLV